MPSGMRVWNAAGQLMVDTSTRMGRVLGIIPVTGNTVWGDNGLLTGTPYYVQYAITGLGATPLAVPTVWFVGNAMHVSFPAGSPGTWIIYGVY